MAGPDDIEVGTTCAVWFGDGFDAWFVGEVVRTYPRNTKADNVKANFDDGAATFFASADTYGVDNTWVLDDNFSKVKH